MCDEGRSSPSFYRPVIVAAAKAGNLEDIRACIDRGCPIDETDTFGMTALMMAAWMGHVDVVRHLIAWGADCRLTTNAGRDARDLARLGRHDMIAAMLDASLAAMVVAPPRAQMGSLD